MERGVIEMLSVIKERKKHKQNIHKDRDRDRESERVKENNKLMSFADFYARLLREREKKRERWHKRLNI